MIISEPCGYSKTFLQWLSISTDTVGHIEQNKTDSDLCYLSVCLQYTLNLFPGHGKMSSASLFSLQFLPIGEQCHQCAWHCTRCSFAWEVFMLMLACHFFLVQNIMWRHGAPLNMLDLSGSTMSCVSTHPHRQAVIFFNTQSCFHCWCEVKNKPFAILHQVLFEYFTRIQREEKQHINFKNKPLNFAAA